MPIPFKPEYIKKRLLRKNEIDFLKVLQNGLKPLHVFPQVSMNAVLDIKNQKSWKDRIHFWAKIIDYVVCMPETFEILAIIEFDGPSHDNPNTLAKDRERDDMMLQAGYIVNRYHWENMPSQNELKADFKKILIQYHIFKDINLAEFSKKIEHLDDD